MKRTASTLLLLAGFSGGCTTPDASRQVQPGGFGTVTTGRQVPGVQGPMGEPVMAASARGVAPGGVKPAGGTASEGGVQWSLFRKYGTPSPSEARSAAYVAGSTGWHSGGKISSMNGGVVQAGGYGGGMPGGPGGPGGPGYPGPQGGILPVPGMGPPGATAGFGAIVPGMGGPGMAAAGMLANGRSSIKFTGPAGMKITWQLPGGGFNDEANGLTAPKEYNFLQGQVYRLRLTQVLPNHPGKSFYPTLEISPANPKSLTFLAHSSVPITFTNEDFDQAVAGNLVVKVVYLPDRENQDFATVAGAEELVSTRLEPGADPVAEAQRRGTILAVIRLGNIDLENRASPAMTAVPGSGMPPIGGPVMIPGPGMGAMPPGGMMPGRPIGPVAPGARPTGPTLPSAPGAPIAPGAMPPGTSSVGGPAALPPIMSPIK